LHFESNNAPPVPGRYEFVYFGVAADNPTLLGGAKPEEMVRVCLRIVLFHAA
jgi:hypothetical protein